MFTIKRSYSCHALTFPRKISCALVMRDSSSMSVFFALEQRHEIKTRSQHLCGNSGHGNWATEELIHACKGCCRSREEACFKVYNALKACVQHAFIVPALNKWTTVYSCVQSIALLSNFHNIFALAEHRLATGREEDPQEGGDPMMVRGVLGLDLLALSCRIPNRKSLVSFSWCWRPR